VILKREVPISNLFSLRRVVIFTQLVIGPMTFSKTIEPLIKLNVPEMFPHQED
jgi:hypothetical protein